MLLLAIDSCNDVHRSGTRSRKFNMFQNVRIKFSSDLCKYFALYSKICVYRCMSMFYKKITKQTNSGSSIWGVCLCSIVTSAWTIGRKQIQWRVIGFIRQQRFSFLYPMVRILKTEKRFILMFINDLYYVS